MKVRELLDELPNPETEGRVTPEPARLRYDIVAFSMASGNDFDVESIRWDSESESLILNIQRR